MRFILQEDVYDYLPDDWDEKVAKALKYVETKVETARADAIREGKGEVEIDTICLEARHKAINAKSDVWRAADKALRTASHDKCWYCETKQDRSDKPVDHFRPKNSVVEDTTHPGYTWLAFDWENFRLSCTFCNSKRRDLEGGTTGGKQDHFPIIPPPPYARCAADPRERPQLLDPTNDHDTKLLTFLINGFPHPSNDSNETVARVEASIKLYHLKQTSLVRKRKRIAADIAEHVSKADAAKAINDDSNFRFHKKEIIKRVRAQAEISTAARVYLGAYRDRPWVEEIFNRDL
jgi:uncharacterized protein (TIGR02646 family)